MQHAKFEFTSCSTDSIMIHRFNNRLSGNSNQRAFYLIGNVITFIICSFCLIWVLDRKTQLFSVLSQLERHFVRIFFFSSVRADIHNLKEQLFPLFHQGGLELLLREELKKWSLVKVRTVRNQSIHR